MNFKSLDLWEGHLVRLGKWSPIWSVHSFVRGDYHSAPVRSREEATNVPPSWFYRIDTTVTRESKVRTWSNPVGRNGVGNQGWRCERSTGSPDSGRGRIFSLYWFIMYFRISKLNQEWFTVWVPTPGGGRLQTPLTHLHLVPRTSCEFSVVHLLCIEINRRGSDPLTM